MHTHPAADLSSPLHIHLNDDWERKYLAARLGVSEEALVASAHSADPTVEEIFATYCPSAEKRTSHAHLHQACVLERAASTKP